MTPTAGAGLFRAVAGAPRHRERALSPRPWSFNSSRHRLREENRAFAETVPAGALVLDAGAGTAPYAPLFAHTRYETADYQRLERDYGTSTYVCDLSEIPVEDARFDAVVFNQVMEHLPEPARVLRELHRVLKPGGRLIYTGPLFYEVHEAPYDFYRYTRYGVRHLFEGAGFTVERLDWLEGYFATVGYQLRRMGAYLPLRPQDLGGGIIGLAMLPVVAATKVLSTLAAPLYHRLEARAKYTRRGYPKNYVAIMRKPTEPA